MNAGAQPAGSRLSGGGANEAEQQQRLHERQWSTSSLLDLASGGGEEQSSQLTQQSIRLEGATMDLSESSCLFWASSKE